MAFTTLEWVDWFNHRRMLGSNRYTTPLDPKNAPMPHCINLQSQRYFNKQPQVVLRSVRSLQNSHSKLLFNLSVKRGRFLLLPISVLRLPLEHLTHHSRHVSNFTNFVVHLVLGKNPISGNFKLIGTLRRERDGQIGK